MQNIAIENNLSETAFAMKESGAYHLRWFTPGGEVELCGHATLATAYVITRFIEPGAEAVTFDTLSGQLRVQTEGDLLAMDFPTFHLDPIPVTERMTEALGETPVEAFVGADTVCVLETEEQVRHARPNQELIGQMDGVCLHITAQSQKYDYVIRSFAPKCGVAEDPVCGRGHCHVAPYWARKVGKSELEAYQASSRGGMLRCSLADERTVLRGKAVLFAESEIYI